MWAPMRLKPLPGTYWPPTANAMMEEEFLVRKYWKREFKDTGVSCLITWNTGLRTSLSPQTILVPCFLVRYPSLLFP